MAIGTPTSLGTPVVSAVGGPYTFTTGVTAPSSSLIIALASFGRSADPGAGTLSGGSLTWQTDAAAVFNGGYFYRFGIYSAPAASGLASSTNLTLTASGATDGVQFAVCYCTGLDLSASRVDVSNGQGASTNLWDSGSATNTNADDLVIGGSFMDAASSSTVSLPLLELFDFQNAGNAWSETVAYKIVAATVSQKVNGTWLNTTNQVSAFVAYKGASSAVVPVDPYPQQSILTLPFMVAFPNVPMIFVPQGVSPPPLDLIVDESSNGIASAEAFGNSTVTIAQTINPSGIVSAEAFGSDRVDLSIAATGIASAEAFGSDRVDLSILGTGIASAEAFGSQTVTVPASGQTVDTTGNSIASAEAFGSDRVDLGLLGTGIGSAEAFGADQVNLGLASVGIGSAETFGLDRVDLGILGAGIPSAETFGSTDRIDQSILGVGIASGEAFGPAVVTGGTVGTGSGGDLATRGYGT